MTKEIKTFADIDVLNQNVIIHYELVLEEKHLHVFCFNL